MNEERGVGLLEVPREGNAREEVGLCIQEAGTDVPR